MLNSETNKNTLSDFGRLELDFKIQLQRSDRCLDLCDVEGAERWNNEAKLTLSKMSKLN